MPVRDPETPTLVAQRAVGMLQEGPEGPAGEAGPALQTEACAGILVIIASGTPASVTTSVREPNGTH